MGFANVVGVGDMLSAVEALPSLFVTSPKTPPGSQFKTNKAKTPRSTRCRGVLHNKSLAMTYFHTGIRTIIGAELFHGPVRDGKGWFQLAMVTRHEGLRRCACVNVANRDVVLVVCIVAQGDRLTR